MYTGYRGYLTGVVCSDGISKISGSLSITNSLKYAIKGRREIKVPSLFKM